jgi:hypothetical protein
MLVDRRRLPGEHRLLRSQPLGAEQAEVGAHPVALAHGQDVARHDQLGRNLHPGIVAPDERRFRHQVGQGRDGPSGPVLLKEADQRVEDDDGEHHGRVLELTERRRGRRRQHERVHERAPYLREEQPCGRRPGGLWKPVRPVPLQACPRLFAAQPARVRLERPQGVVLAAGVPIAGFGRRRHRPLKNRYADPESGRAL